MNGIRIQCIACVIIQYVHLPVGFKFYYFVYMMARIHQMNEKLRLVLPCFFFRKTSFAPSRQRTPLIFLTANKHAKQSFVLSSRSFLSGFYIALCHLFDTSQQCRRSMKRLEVVPEERTLLVLRLRSIVYTQGQSHRRRYKYAVRGWIVGIASKVQQWEFCMV